VTDLPARGDQISTIVSGKPDKIVTRNLVAAFFIITKGICTKNVGVKYQLRLADSFDSLVSGFLSITSVLRRSKPFSAVVMYFRSPWTSF
jgi:hypothetical protein